MAVEGPEASGVDTGELPTMMGSNEVTTGEGTPADVNTSIREDVNWPFSAEPDAEGTRSSGTEVEEDELTAVTAERGPLDEGRSRPGIVRT